MKQREFVVLSDLKDGKVYETYDYGRVMFRKRAVVTGHTGGKYVRAVVKGKQTQVPINQFILEKKKPAKNAAERKRDQRARDKEAGLVNVRLRLTPEKLQQMQLVLHSTTETPRALVERAIDFMLYASGIDLDDKSDGVPF